MTINNIDLKSYLNELNKIHKEINLQDSDNQLRTMLSNLDNYVDQFCCVKKSDIFSNKDINDVKMDENEIKTKLLRKINQLINEQFELFDSFLLVIKQYIFLLC
jgi:hypothetical protein